MSTIERLASLYTEIGYVQIQHSCFARLTEFCETPDGILQLTSEASTEPIATQPLFQSGTPEAIKKTFLSTNRCVTAVAWNSKLLAWVLEGFDIDLHEKSFAKPIPTKKFEMWEEGQEQPDRDRWHTVLAFIPKSGGEALVADPSHHQYSWESGIDRLSDFLGTKVERTSQDLDWDFGDALDLQSDLDKDHFSKTLSDVVAKTTCNVVVQETTSIGGVETLLSMGETEYETAQGQILAALDRELYELRIKLDDVVSDEDLEELEAECDGPGHELCSAAYERIMTSGF